MSDPPAAKRTRLNDEVKLTDDEIKVVKIQFGKDNAFPGFDALLREYCRFLELKLANPNIPLAPSYLVDKLWHAHILSTREYLAFCERHNQGEYLHHDPTMKRGQKRYGQTLERYEELYGKKPDDKDIWPSHVEQKPSKKRMKALKQEANDAQIKQEANGAQVIKQETGGDRDIKQEAIGDRDIKQEMIGAQVVKQEADGARVKRDRERNVDADEKPRKRAAKLEEGEIPLNQEGEGAASLKREDEDEAQVQVQQESEKSEDEEGEEYQYDFNEYDSDQREYLEDYGDERGTTQEELAEWHKEAIKDPANNEGFDPHTVCQCINGHQWVKGEFDLYCSGCRESSQSLGSFSCG